RLHRPHDIDVQPGPPHDQRLSVVIEDSLGVVLVAEGVFDQCRTSTCGRLDLARVSADARPFGPLAGGRVIDPLPSALDNALRGAIEELAALGGIVESYGPNFELPYRGHDKAGGRATGDLATGRASTNEALNYARHRRGSQSVEVIGCEPGPAGDSGDGAVDVLLSRRMAVGRGIGREDDPGG